MVKAVPSNFGPERKLKDQVVDQKIKQKPPPKVSFKLKSILI